MELLLYGVLIVQSSYCIEFLLYGVLIVWNDNFVWSSYCMEFLLHGMRIFTNVFINVGSPSHRAEDFSMFAHLRQRSCRSYRQRQSSCGLQELGSCSRWVPSAYGVQQQHRSCSRWFPRIAGVLQPTVQAAEVSCSLRCRHQRGPAAAWILQQRGSCSSEGPEARESGSTLGPGAVGVLQQLGSSRSGSTQSLAFCSSGGLAVRKSCRTQRCRASLCSNQIVTIVKEIVDIFATQTEKAIILYLKQIFLGINICLIVIYILIYQTYHQHQEYLIMKNISYALNFEVIFGYLHRSMKIRQVNQMFAYV